MVAQWSPLLMAAVFLPWLAPVALAKPNIGLPVLALWPRKLRWLVVTAVVRLISLMILPLWPLAWLQSVFETGHWPAIIVPPGIVLALAVKRWRTREGQLLLWPVFVPQFQFWYDQLLLWIIPRNHRQSLALVASSWTGFELWTLFLQRSNMAPNVVTAMPVSIANMYISALIIVLRQPIDVSSETPYGDTWRSLLGMWRRLEAVRSVIGRARRRQRITGSHQPHVDG